MTANLVDTECVEATEQACHDPVRNRSAAMKRARALLATLSLLLVFPASGRATPPAARPLAPLAELQGRCAADCPRAVRVDLAIQRAAVWLAGYPDDLQFDAAVLLSLIRANVDSAELRTAFARARTRADHDHDHPHRRLWATDMISPPEHTSRWQAPAPGAARVNTNRVLSEALHCRENGWRELTENYACGAMRDTGGYHTTHAIWSLDIARRNGCTVADECLASLRAELLAAQPAELRAKSTLEIDLYAERAVMLLRTGTAASAASGWVDALLGLQRADGSWGAGTDPVPYYRYHATAAVVWALAEWSKERGQPSPTPQP